MSMGRALLVIDFINELVDPKGQLAQSYAKFIAQHNTLGHLNTAIEAFRETKDPVIFIRLAFQADYSDLPRKSPVFKDAQRLGIFARGTWSVDIHSDVDYRSDDITLVKNRIDAFYDTGLSNILRELKIADVYIAGVTTNLAVKAAALRAHDLDFGVTVVSNACVAVTRESHERSLDSLDKIAQLVNAADLLPE